jgi:3-oxoacyl-[acyl-carrier protein] reductase
MPTEPAAIITGAGRGIGRATAVALSERGYRCVLVSRSIDDLNHTAQLCEGASVACPCDVNDPQHVARAVELARTRFGRIDALVNNAGAAPLVPFADMTEQIWRDTLDTNLTATFRFCRAVWNDMVRQGAGVIVNVSSEATRDPFDGFSAYASAKAGVNLLTKCLAREGAAYGIRCHAVAPAGVETAMLRSIVPETMLGADQVLQPTDVAHTIRAIVTGELRHTSGEVIYLHRGA